MKLRITITSELYIFRTFSEIFYRHPSPNFFTVIRPQIFGFFWNLMTIVKKFFPPNLSPKGSLLVTKFSKKKPSIQPKKHLTQKKFFPTNFFVLAQSPPKVCSFENSSKTGECFFRVLNSDLRNRTKFSKRVGNFAIFS